MTPIKKKKKDQFSLAVKDRGNRMCSFPSFIHPLVRNDLQRLMADASFFFMENPLILNLKAHPSISVGFIGFTLNQLWWRTGAEI